MGSRADITRSYARVYAKASKKQRGVLLDEVVAVTGWSRDNARRRLAAAAKPGPRSVPERRPRPRKYPYDVVKVLQRVWAASGYQCGKYLAAAMPALLESLQAHGELVIGSDRFDTQVRAALLKMFSGDDRPVSRASAEKRRDQWLFDDETLAVAALLDHDP